MYGCETNWNSCNNHYHIITIEAVGTDLQTVVSVKVKDIQKVILQ